jgi:hypothetical protein
MIFIGLEVMHSKKNYYEYDFLYYKMRIHDLKHSFRKHPVINIKL